MLDSPTGRACERPVGNSPQGDGWRRRFRGWCVPRQTALNDGIEGVWSKIANDLDFVGTHKLESIRETISLDYPSYILALTMGAGKTALIGSIIATEFALAMEYPDGPFMKNALVFAPGKTILGSLRQIASLPYDRVLPERLHKFFAATVKLIFTRDGDPDIPVIRGDSFNVIITNTTGTPYLNRQPLLDVVFWYGLSQGIRDGILKPVAGHIHAYTFDDQSTDDFLVEYKDVDGRWRHYCPDFIIRRKDGRCLIIEIKRDDPALAEDETRIARGEKPATTEGRKALAMRRWENLNPDRLKYQLVRVADSLPAAATREAAAFAREK